MHYQASTLFSSFKLLLSSWKESVTFFSFTTIKQFVLITLKALKDFYAIGVQKNIFVVLFINAVLFYILVSNELVQFITGVFITFLIVNAFRPSVDLKNTGYFNTLVSRGLLYAFDVLFFFLYVPYAFISGTQHNVLLVTIPITISLVFGLVKFAWKKNITLASGMPNDSWTIGYGIFFLLFCLGILFLIFMEQPLFSGSSLIIFKNMRSWILSLFMIDEHKLFLKLSVFAYFFSPFVVVLMLFIADAQCRLKEYVKAIGRAAIMIVYNYPFFLLVFLAIRALLLVLHSSLFMHYAPIIIIMRALIAGVILPVYIAVISNYYIKRIHEQFQLYYS